MRPSIVSILIVLLAARTFAAAPASAPATLPAIPSVTSLEDLRALPPISVDGWEARVGIADGGRDAGPWKVLYCLAKRVGDEKGALQSPKTSETLGPFSVEFERVPREGVVLKKVQENVVRARQIHGKDEVLFARIVPLASKGKWDLTLSPAATEAGETPPPLLRSHFEVADGSPLYWQQFAEIERFQDERDDTRFRYIPLAKPFAALPQIDGDADLLPTTRPTAAPADNNPQKENRLPGGVPLLGGWVQSITGTKGPAADDAPPLSLSLEEGWFVVQSHGPRLLDWADQRLLARWWVNGDPIPAPRATRSMLQQSRLVRTTTEIRVRFGLPTTLGELKAGDRVAMQVLYTPKDMQPVFEGSEQKQQQMQMQLTQGDANCLLPSNRIEFLITEQMIRDRK